MKINEDIVSEIKKAFESDYGLRLTDKQTKEATGSLVDFFYLLWKFDREDKEKLIKMKNFKNEPESL